MSVYESRVVQQLWKYAEDRFPSSQNFFDKWDPNSARPPVFRKDNIGKNVIVNPDATPDEEEQLLNLIPDRARHRWFGSMKSSQALAQTILGNLWVSGSFKCLAGLRDDDGLPLFGDAGIDSANFSMEHEIESLGEPRATSLDAFIDGKYRVAIECKFTERDVGTCSRPRLKETAANYKHDFCNGTYSVQRGRKSRCSLTDRGVRYWEYIPQVLTWKSTEDLAPCPLRDNYQLVRNVLAVAVRSEVKVSSDGGHALLIYDSENPAFRPDNPGGQAYLETKRALRKPEMLRKISWQRIVCHMRKHGMLCRLTDELALKYGS
ncbi:MAG TPA: hypothetical protein VJ983_00745 [candidate division Zixibacteria bacterium]|nr:hypothetical protein [candidate division Zixibacteria bacterium]